MCNMKFTKISSVTHHVTYKRHDSCYIQATYLTLCSRDMTHVLREQDRQASAWPETHVKIRRQHVVEDGFNKLGGYRSELKGVVKVHFVNESGLDESGIVCVVRV